LNILFICTHNRCRSAICEAITNHLSDGRLQAFSAGSQPAGQLHPLTIRYLEKRGISTLGLKSESWDVYFDKNIDVAITVCDSAAAEGCPLWMGDTLRVHWGVSDPSKLEDSSSEAEIEKAFGELMDKVESRIRQVLKLDLDNLSRASIEQQFQELASGD
jgi:arsenate reductase